MKKQFFNYQLIIILFTLLFSACQTQNETKPDIVSQNGGYEVTNYSSINALQHAVKRTANSTNIAEEGDLLNGQKTGLWATYYPSNKLQSLTNYYQGVKHGLCLEYNEAEVMVAKWNYLNGNLEGLQKKYENYLLKEEQSYKNGQLNGPRKMYYTNGKVKEDGNFVNGKRDGATKWYNEQGELTIEYEYKNGEKVSEKTK